MSALTRDEQGRLIWDWVCIVCKTEWTSGDQNCPKCRPLPRRQSTPTDNSEETQ